MCGIFGLISVKENFNSVKIFKDLYLLSETRGKEASGFAVNNKNELRVFKTPVSASQMVQGRLFKEEMAKIFKEQNRHFRGIGHSRLVTDGHEQFDDNNQPVVKNGMAVIHNGIIVNQHELWKEFDSTLKISELDSELIPTIIDDQLNKGKSLGEAINIFYGMIYGMTNIALLFTKYNNLVLATNNGSIYYIFDKESEFFTFASEKQILSKLCKKNKIEKFLTKITQLKPREIGSLNFVDFDFEKVRFGQKINNLSNNSNPLTLIQLNDNAKIRQEYINVSLDHSVDDVKKEYIEEYERRKFSIDNLRRCTKCILPETFPFIEFDEHGVCNYCNGYHKIEYKGYDIFQKDISKFRKKNQEPECLLPFSGGRDSSYVLHFVVKELGLKPIAFSYDWGMITDLARRNQARMCGKLGVEHILISADIRKKRKNIQKNVEAWLKRPNLGTIPLFMAGDKQYFYYANRLMNENNIQLSILGENLLETTNFKTGFCGVKPSFSKGHTYSLKTQDKIRMMAYYGKQYLLNPSLVNSSLIDTLDAFKSYYVIKHNNVNLFNYIRWDEKNIIDLLVKDYDWETDPGTNSTWRIGDGTAAFYNFIYYMVAGFTENDTFRSNQVREGDITRQAALQLAMQENAPRWDSLQWYLRTISIDFYYAINKILQIESKYNDKGIFY